MNQKPIVAVTMSEAAGIGPEVLLKAFSEGSIYDYCCPLAVGDLEILQKASEICGIECKFNVIEDPAQGLYRAGIIDLIDMQELNWGDFKISEPNELTGRSMLDQTRKVVNLFLEGKVDGTVGGPHSKYAAELAGEHFEGYPDLIARMTGEEHPYLMLSNGKLCVSNVTLHVSLRKAIDMLSIDLVYHCIKETEKAVRAFGIEKPRIAVSGLNPHAGENRMFGDEDEDIIKPAIKHAQDEGILVTGPYPADSLFNGCLENDKFDGYVAMYHDQAHLPVKVLVFDQSSAIAIGVPVNWATVDHGCALDIAWKNQARPSAMIATIKLIAKRAKGFRSAWS